MKTKSISPDGGETRIERPDPPPRIRFSPNRGESNREASERRAAAIFGPVDIRDPWTRTPPVRDVRSSNHAFAEAFLEGAPRPEHPLPMPFQLVPSEFLRRAQRRPPEQPEATASAFAQWLYSLYGTAFGSEEDREGGLAVEPEILAFRRRAFSLVDADYLRQWHPKWELLHCGLHVRDDAVVPYFRVDDLRVHGQAMRGSPDLVYRHQTTGEVIVVEIKFSKMAIPSNLWPNVWGQLWCYAQLPVVRAASRVTVVGEVWGEHRDRRRGRSLYLRASVRRDPRETAFDRFFRTLFDIYRGRDSVR